MGDGAKEKVARKKPAGDLKFSTRISQVQIELRKGSVVWLGCLRIILSISDLCFCLWLQYLFFIRQLELEPIWSLCYFFHLRLSKTLKRF